MRGFRDADDIAWESNQIARSDIYAVLRIPVEPCEPPAAVCGNEPQARLNSAYMDHADVMAGHQLAKAGFWLASLLNGIWVQPITPGGNTVTRAASPPEQGTLGPSSETYAPRAWANSPLFPITGLL